MSSWFHLLLFPFFYSFSEERWITSVLERKIWNSNDKVIFSVAADNFVLCLFIPWIICGTEWFLLHLNFTEIQRGCHKIKVCGNWFMAGRPSYCIIKPWPNEDASWRRLKTWFNMRLRLARAYVHLRWLATTCVHFVRDQICTQVDASFSPFGRPTQVNASWVTSINLLLANKIEDSLP